MNWLRKLWSRICGWILHRQPPQLPKHEDAGVQVPTPAPPVLDVRERELGGKSIVGPPAFITNDSDATIILEGSILKRLVIGTHSSRRVESPVLEVIRDPFPPHHMKIREWDALEVLDNMVKEHARAIAYDLMTPDEIKRCTLPFPDRALGVILDRAKLKAHR